MADVCIEELREEVKSYSQYHEDNPGTGTANINFFYIGSWSYIKKKIYCAIILYKCK